MEPVLPTEKDPLTGRCLACDGRTIVTRDGALARCPCYWEALTMRVPPMLRHGEVMLMDGWKTMEVWPLTSRTVIGGEADYHVFRYQAWRSILHYAEAPRGPVFRCEAMEAGRIAEIHFGRDTGEYRSYRELVKTPLLILICGRRDLPTAFAVDLTRIVLGLREDHGVPSWVYATHKTQLGRTMDEVIRDAPRDAVSAKSPTQAPDTAARHSRREDEAPAKSRKRWKDDD